MIPVPWNPLISRSFTVLLSSSSSPSPVDWFAPLKTITGPSGLEFSCKCDLRRPVDGDVLGENRELAERRDREDAAGVTGVTDVGMLKEIVTGTESFASALRIACRSDPGALPLVFVTM